MKQEEKKGESLVTNILRLTLRSVSKREFFFSNSRGDEQQKAQK